MKAEKEETFQNKVDSFRHAIYVAEEQLHKKLPEDLSIENNLRGNSAGMMTTLELMHEFGDVDLLRGHLVCGTGTIETDGKSTGNWRTVSKAGRS